jgi:putative ABC transport system permease protein
MINILIEIAPSGLLQGLMLSLLVTGVMIPFRLLNFPDLTTEGSYPLGGGIVRIVNSCRPTSRICTIYSLYLRWNAWSGNGINSYRI